MTTTTTTKIVTTTPYGNKPGRVIRCVPQVIQAQIAVFGGFSLMVTDGRTERPFYRDAGTHLKTVDNNNNDYKSKSDRVQKSDAFWRSARILVSQSSVKH